MADKKRPTITKFAFDKPLSYNFGKNNDGWNMRGYYYTTVTKSGEVRLNIKGVLGAPVDLELDKSHFASWVISSKNDLSSEWFWTGHEPDNKSTSYVYHKVSQSSDHGLPDI